MIQNARPTVDVSHIVVMITLADMANSLLVKETGNKTQDQEKRKRIE